MSPTSWTFYQGKRTLLPLRKAEEKTVIFPWSLSVQASEMRNLVRRPWGQARGLPPQPRAQVPERARAGRAALPSSGPRLLGQGRELVETVPVLLLLLLLCGLDWALYSIFDTIRHHSFLQYSFRSEPSPSPLPPRPPPLPAPRGSDLGPAASVSKPPLYLQQGGVSAQRTEGTPPTPRPRPAPAS